MEDTQDTGIPGSMQVTKGGANTIDWRKMGRGWCSSTGVVAKPGEVENLARKVQGVLVRKSQQSDLPLFPILLALCQFCNARRLVSKNTGRKSQQKENPEMSEEHIARWQTDGEMLPTRIARHAAIGWRKHNNLTLTRFVSSFGRRAAG